jgi:hypothetical protein
LLVAEKIYWLVYFFEGKQSRGQSILFLHILPAISVINDARVRLAALTPTAFPAAWQGNS